MTIPPIGALLLPLAAPGDWLEALLPILFVLFWVVSQVMNIAKALRGPDRRPPPPVPVARPAARPPDAVREELARQIDAFRRGQAEGPRPPAPAPKPREDRTPARVPATSGQRRAGPAPQPARPSVSPPVPRPAGLSGPSTFGGHAGDIARHVEGAFAHDLSHSASGVRPDLLAGSGPAAPVAAAAGSSGSTAADLVAMIRDPSTLRRVILLREILDRPVDRW